LIVDLTMTAKIRSMMSDSSSHTAGIDHDQDGAVGRAATAVRNLIMSRQLVPGQQLRQEELAQQIGMSRGPLREALQVLAAEGVLNYVRNRGYFVTQLTADEMKQVYLIRDLLESEILKSLPLPGRDHILALRTINAQIRDETNDVLEVIRLNKQFHDLMTATSPLKLLNAEVEQLGRMAIAYQALALNFLTGWDSIADDHEEMISALERADHDRLVEVGRVHRGRTLARLRPVLQ
jgi:DNA-binding GntR family transcriptional regulator